MTPAQEREILALLRDCPLGIHSDRVIAARNTPESDVVAWLTRLYDLRDRLRARRRTT